MLTRLADLGIAFPRRVLAVAGVLIVAGAVYGISAASHLSGGGFSDPHAQSSRAKDLLAQRFDTGTANLVLEVSAPGGVDSAAARAEGTRVATRLERSRYATQVAGYWTAPRQQAAALRSDDGRSGIVVARIAGDDNSAPKRVADLTDALVGTHDGVRVRAGGESSVYAQANTRITSDLAIAEAIAVPLTMIALIWVFGSLIAALLPLAVGLTAIIGTMAALRGLATMTDVSIYALNMTTAMGLALAIDYSLFVVSRYREEIAAGAHPDEAVRTTMRTAGRTVLFSALTVGLSLAALLVFPVYFLRSFAYAGIAVVALATIAALLLLPALLTLLGRRVNSLDMRAGVRRLFHRPTPIVKPIEQGFWYRFATAIMRRALPVGLLITAVLVVVGLPFLHANFGYPDERVLPQSAPAYQVGQDLREDYHSDATSAINVVVPDLGGERSAIGPYAAALSRVTDVQSVTAASGTYAGGHRVRPPAGASMIDGTATYLTVQTGASAQSAEGKRVLADVRDVAAPWHRLYGGTTAENEDSLAALADALPLALALIALATFVVLFLFTGSVILPIKALALNVLSLSATFGAMVWVFQEGHVGWLFPDLTVTGYLVPTMPPLMFCVAFGLSMDYEVFLLSRIREAWLHSDRTTADNTHAVALGLGRTGRIVTAAALLMAIVFACIAGSSVSFIMLFGTGLTLAVVMDATVVRGMLVPAFMRLAGRWNWWAPRPLARLHHRFGLDEGPSAPVPRPEQELVPAG